MNEKQEWAYDIGALILRLGAGATMALRHGIPKLQKLSTLVQTFPDPLGVGHEKSAYLAVGAELGASVLIALGLLTRLSAIPAAFTMGVAFFVIHAADPMEKKELALLYLIAFTAVVFVGPGRFSLDRWLGPRLRRLVARQ